MSHSKFDLAMEAVTNGKALRTHSLLSVGRAYLDHLLLLQDYEEAGKLCQQILGKCLVQLVIICFQYFGLVENIAFHVSI